MKTAKFLTTFLLLTLVTLFISSCEGDPAEPAVTEYGKVLLFHGAPSGAGIDLYIDGVKVTTNTLGYGQPSAYVQATAGTTAHKILMKDITGKTLDSASLQLNKDVGYSYYTYKDTDGTIRVKTTTDALTAPAAGKAKVRVVHLIPDVTNNVALDIQSVAVGGVATQANDFTQVKFKESKDFIELPKGTFDLKIKEYGTTNLIINNPIQITLAEGKIYTLVLHGLSAKLNTDPLYTKVSVITNN